MKRSIGMWVLVGLVGMASGVCFASDLARTELRPDCGYVFNPTAGAPPGFDDMVSMILTIMRALPGISLPDITWQEADLEGYDGNTFFGDGIPDWYEWGMLGAVLCAGDPLIVSQFNANKQAMDGLVAELTAMAEETLPIKDVVGGIAADIGLWSQDLPDDDSKAYIQYVSYLLDDTAYALDHKVGAYLPVILNVMPQYSSWFAMMGGLSSGARTTMYSAFQDILDPFVSTCPGQPISHYRINEEQDGVQFILAGTFAPPLPADLATRCTNLIALSDNLLAKIMLLHRPDFVIFGASPKAPGEPFAADGDYNGDGLTNKQVYDLVTQAGGDRFDYVRAATSNNGFWPGNTALPILSPIGLAALIAACGFTGARKARGK